MFVVKKSLQDFQLWKFSSITDVFYGDENKAHDCGGLWGEFTMKNLKCNWNAFVGGKLSRFENGIKSFFVVACEMVTS